MTQNQHREIRAVIAKHLLNEKTGDTWVKFTVDYGANVERMEYEDSMPPDMDKDRTDWEEACKEVATDMYKMLTKGLTVGPLKPGKERLYMAFTFGFTINPADLPELEKRVKVKDRKGNLVNNTGSVEIHTYWLDDNGKLETVKQ